MGRQAFRRPTSDRCLKFFGLVWLLLHHYCGAGAPPPPRSSRRATAFALYLPEVSLKTYASYLVVVNRDGSIAAAHPTTDVDDGPESTHFDAVKMMTPTRVLAYSNVWDAESGRPYAWDWLAGAPEPLNDVRRAASETSR